MSAKARVSRASLPLLDKDNAMPPTSSPDPLGNSVLEEEDDNDLAPPPRAVRPSPTKRRRGSTSHTVQFEDIILATPTKKNTRYSSPVATDQNRNPSPWRIRVTVEAEPENADERNVVPRQTRTRVQKVPLKIEEGDSIASSKPIGGARGAGAVKSSPMKNAPGRQRSLTPVRGRGRGRRKSVTDLDITVLGDEDGDEMPAQRRRPRGRPRKSKVDESGRGTPEIDTSQGKPTTGRQKANALASDFEIAIDEGVPDEQMMDRHEEEASQNSSSDLRELDLNRVALRPRPGNTLKIDQSRRPQSAPEDEIEKHTSTRQVSASTDYPTPEPSAEGEDSQNEEPIRSDPTDQHEEFDTIMESEGFTMISLDSLSSTKQSSDLRQQSGSSVDHGNSQRQSPPASSRTAPLPHQPASSAHSKQSTKHLSALPSHLRPEDYSDISSTVPTPPPMLYFATTPNAPAQTCTSPTLPSPPPNPKHASLSSAKATPPRLSRVVRAGIALQGVLSPPRQLPSGRSVATHQRLRSPLVPQKQKKIAASSGGGGGGGEAGARERLDDLFGGFDSGMKRELRAGLRFGEELARRMEGKGTTTGVELGDEAAEEASSISGLANADREQERESPLERAIVSRRVRGGGPELEEVIAVDTDNKGDSGDKGGATAASNHGGQNAEAPNYEYEGHSEIDDHGVVEGGEIVDDTDIWLSEADRSSSLLQDLHSSPPSSQESRPKPQPKPKELPLQSRRRSAIPSPWKRGEGLDRSSFAHGEDIEATEMSGLFWMQSRAPAKLKRESVLSAGFPSDGSGETSKKFDIQGIFRQRTGELEGESGLEGSQVEDKEDDEDRGTVLAENNNGNDDDDNNEEDVFVSDDCDNEEETVDEAEEGIISDEIEGHDGEEEAEERLTTDYSAQERSALKNNLEAMPSRKKRLSPHSTDQTSTSPSPSTSTSTPALSDQNPQSSTLSLPSSPPPAALPPQKVPVNFGDSTSLLTDGASSSSSLSLPTNKALPSMTTSTSTSGPCTPILKKSGLSVERDEHKDGRKGSRKKKSKRRVSFSPVVDTRCFEVVTPTSSDGVEGSGSGSGSTAVGNVRGGDGEGDSIEDEDEDEEDEIEVERPPSRHGPPVIKTETRQMSTLGRGRSKEMEARTQTQTQTQAAPSSSSSSWLGRLGSWFNGPSSSSSSSPSTTATTTTTNIGSSKPKSSSSTKQQPQHRDSNSEEKEEGDDDFTNSHHRFLLCLYLQSLGLDPGPYSSRLGGGGGSTTTLSTSASASASASPGDSNSSSNFKDKDSTPAPTPTSPGPRPRPSIAALVGRVKYKYKYNNATTIATTETKKGKEKQEWWVLDTNAAVVLEKWYRAVETVEGAEKWRGREREVGRRLVSCGVGWEERTKEREGERVS